MVHLQLRLLLPPFVLVLALWLAYRVLAGEPRPLASVEALALGIGVLLVFAINIELVLLRPLRALRDAMDALRAGVLGPDGTPRKSGALVQMAQQLRQLDASLRDNALRLAHESAEREKLQRAVRELEERYMLSVDRAGDGTWEWDLKTQGVRYSPRWQGMLGQPQQALPMDIEGWRALLHPDDSEGLLRRLDDHLQGRSPRFEAEYRVRRADGDFRWLQSRGTAIRHASGKPYRMIFVDSDIHQRKALETALVQAAESLAATSEIGFFEALMKSLSTILGTRDNLACYLVGDPPTRARTLAYYRAGEQRENIEYELAGTSCGAVIQRRDIVYVPNGVCDIWPAERQYDRDSYLGVPMFDSGGRIIGHFACMDGAPMRQDLPHLALFRIFSVRAAAELERLMLRGSLPR